MKRRSGHGGRARERAAGREEAGRRAWRWTADFLNGFPQRHLGLPGMRRAAGALERAWRQALGPGAVVRVERFTARGGGFLGWLRPAVLLYLAGCVALSCRWSWAAAGCFALILAWAGCRFVCYWRWPDRLFPKCDGWNVTGRIEPGGPADRQVILAAHWDAARVFRWLEQAPRRYVCRVVLAGLAPLLGLAVAAGMGLAPSRWWSVPAWCGLAAVAPLWHFLDRRRISPGAGDNLAGVGVVREAAGAVARERLRRTRVLALAFDGEECGLLGAAAWLARHRDECAALPTVVINIDTVYRSEQVSVLVRDRNGLTALSAELAGALTAVAEREGIAIAPACMPFGGGATDAAVFARSGIPAVTLSVSTEVGHGDLSAGIYHTGGDRMNAVDPGALDRLCRLIAAYLRQADAAPDAARLTPRRIPRRSAGRPGNCRC